MGKVYGFIYITTNLINGKQYIGKRVLDDNGIWKDYLGSGVALNNAINKYGKENFHRNIVSLAHSDDELCCLEKEFIKNHNAVESKDYYNIAYGGKGGTTRKGMKNSEETRRKISENHADFTGENHPRWNRVDYACDYCGNVFKLEYWKSKRGNNYCCDECLKKGKSISLSKSNKGRKLSEEHIRQMSESRKGVYCGLKGEEHSNSKAVYLYKNNFELAKRFGSQRECCEWFVEQRLSNKPECLKPVIKRNIDKNKLYKDYYFYSHEITEENIEACKNFKPKKIDRNLPTGLNHPTAKIVVATYPSGEETYPMTQHDMSKLLNTSSHTIKKYAEIGEIINSHHSKTKHLNGIKIRFLD